MVDELKRICNELYELRIVNRVDDVKLTSYEDSEYAYHAVARFRDGFEVEIREPHHD